MDIDKLKEDLKKAKSDYEKLKLVKQNLEKENFDLEEVINKSKVDLEDHKKFSNATITELKNEIEKMQDQIKYNKQLHSQTNEDAKEK